MIFAGSFAKKNQRWSRTVTTYRLISHKQKSNDEHIYFDIENGRALFGTFYVARGNNGLFLYAKKEW